MTQYLRPALVLLALLVVLTGVLYPITVTGLAQLFFPERANGSLLMRYGMTTGSVLIGQQFTKPEYFWGRLSATSPVPYNAAASSGSNLGPLNPAIRDAAAARVAKLRIAEGTNRRPVPIDLVTASGSGLDPHISVAAAVYQIPRVAAARSMLPESLRAVVDRHIEDRGLGFLGERRVNVVVLNLALDSYSKAVQE